MGSFLPSETSAAKGSRCVAVGARRPGRPSPARISRALLLPLGDDLRQEGVGAGGVVGRVGEGQDGLVVADGEALDLAEGGVGQLRPQALDGGRAFDLIALGGVCGGLDGEEGKLLGHVCGVVLMVVVLLGGLCSEMRSERRNREHRWVGVLSGSANTRPSSSWLRK